MRALTVTGVQTCALPTWRHAVRLSHLEVRLVNVEVVQLAGFVPDSPFFDRAERDARVDAVRVEGAAVYVERVAVGRFGEHDGTAIGDAAAQVGNGEQVLG